MLNTIRAKLIALVLLALAVAIAIAAAGIYSNKQLEATAARAATAAPAGRSSYTRSAASDRAPRSTPASSA